MDGKRNMGEWLELVLLALVAAGTIVTATEIRAIARDGLSLEISVDQVEEIVDAYRAAVSDMQEGE